MLLQVDKTGLKHTLTIRNITPEEKAEFSVEVYDNNYKPKHSACKVHVTAKAEMREFCFRFYIQLQSSE